MHSLKERSNQVAAREQYINEVVAKVDDTLRKTFEKLAESTRESVTQLRNNSVSEFDALLKHYSEQKEEFARMLQEQREEFAARNAETTELMKEIRNLADIKAVMGQLVESTKVRQQYLRDWLVALKTRIMVEEEKVSPSKVQCNMCPLQYSLRA